MRQIAGFIPADYLIEHAARERRYERVPASLWDALLHRIHDPVDTVQLARSAANRLLYGYAIPFYRHAVANGSQFAAHPLAKLLSERGDFDAAKALLRTDAAGSYAEVASEVGITVMEVQHSGTHRLADLLADRGDEEGLRELADSGEEHAVGRLSSSPHGMTWTERSRYCAATRTPEAGAPVAGWLTCWPIGVTRKASASSPIPVRNTPSVGWLSSSPHGMTWTERSRYCAATRTPEAGAPVAGWLTCWPMG